MRDSMKISIDGPCASNKMDARLRKGLDDRAGPFFLRSPLVRKWMRGSMKISTVYDHAWKNGCETP
jgi:hypothetical protein